MTNLAELLSSDAPASEPLVHWEDRTVTRGEIVAAVDDLGRRLRRAGVAPDTAVSAEVPSSPVGVATLFGVWAAGAVCAPLDPARSEPERDRWVADVRPAVVVKPSHDPESLTPQVVARAGEARRYDDEVALVVATAGTAGPPKQVMLDHAAVLASVDAALGAAAWGEAAGDGRSAPDEPRVVATPLAGWTGIQHLLRAVRGGRGVVVLDPFSSERFADAVRRFGLRFAALTPAMIEQLADDPALGSLEPLRRVSSGSALLAVEVARRFRARFGVTVLNSYGQTELGGGVAEWSGADARRHGDAKLGSVGRPVEGATVRIVRGDGTDAAAEEPGAVWARSPFLMRGYASRPRASAAWLDERGWVRTGDIGHVDADGFLWIDGREGEDLAPG